MLKVPLVQLRVGLFTECYRPIQNGVVASVDGLAEVLRERGHDVVCVTPRVPGYHEVGASVLRVPSLPLPARTAYRLTVPLPSRQRSAALDSVSIVHAHSPFVTGWMGVRCARRLQVPLVYTYHTQLDQYTHYVPFEAQATRRAATQLVRSYANSANAVIVPTVTMERRLREQGVHTRIDVVPSGIDIAQFANGQRSERLRARYGVPADGKLILTVGRLAREKNLHLALESVAYLNDPSAHLVIVGDGPSRGDLERAAQRLGIAARTHFTRELPRASLPDIYASADVFVFTSLTETQGLVLIEALASGISVVAVDAPQTREVLGEAGTLADAEPQSVAAALRSTLAGDPQAATLGKRVAARYDVTELAGRVLDVYASLLAS